MSHYFCVVLVPAESDLDEAVDKAMEPYYENDGDNEAGWWDWWQIGGRWTGVWAEYDPTKDPANWEPCIHCQGTGKRMDPRAVEYRATHPDYGCNGCWGGPEPGVAVKHPGYWVRLDNDSAPVSTVLRNLSLLREPFRIVTPTDSVARERWTGDDFEKHEDFSAAYREALEANQDMVAVVVDYHS